jgi:hypothetical protein
MELREFIKNTIRECLNEQLNIETEDVENFKEALLNLTTLDLEDDQVRIPQFNEKTDSYLFQVGNDNTYLYIRKRNKIPISGPFELFILDINDDVIGFIRGTKDKKLISFNLVYLVPEKRGWGIGYDIYEHFLNNGYTIKSDDEITDGTYSLYLKLLKNGFKPIVFDDDRVGLKK